MVHEISIEKFIANDRSPASLDDLRSLGVEGAVFADEVVSEIEASRARVLLVRVSGPGGHIDGSDAIYRALRAFSARGGRVVSWLSGPRVASSAPKVALAADHVLTSQDVVVYLHSASGPTPESVAASNREMAATLAERTAMPPGAIEACLAVGGRTEDGAQRAISVPLEEMLKNGFVDYVASEDVARGLARALDAGEGSLRRRDEEGGALWALRRQPRPCVFTVTSPPPEAAAARAESVATFAISADKIAANTLSTSNYSEDANGIPTAGAKLDHQGTALKVAAGNLQVGDTVLSALSLGKVDLVVGRIRVFGAGYFDSAPTAYGVNVRSWVYTTWNGWAYAINLSLDKRPSATRLTLLAVPRVNTGETTQTWEWRVVGVSAPTGASTGTATLVLYNQNSGNKINPGAYTYPGGTASWDLLGAWYEESGLPVL